MFSPLSIFIVICLYMGLLFILATAVENRRALLGGYFFWIYSLSLGVFDTSWAFYGNVGDAATYGFRYLAMDIGSYSCLALWWLLLKRMVQVKQALHITSIADLIAARYNRSQFAAALVSLIALFGSIPYVGLQLKAVNDSIAVITNTTSGDTSQQLAGFSVSVILLLFTILYGLRKLDPTEHHYGMLVVLAVECVIKLLALLAVGLFVTFGLFQGFGDIFAQAKANNLHQVTGAGLQENSISTFLSLFIIGFFPLLLLPRQFYIAVVENTSQSHIKPAAWVMAGYVLLFSIFIVPIAAAGLLKGLPLEQADMFVLLLPLQANSPVLSLTTFIGGFAAASGMVIITTIAVSTMISNHLVLPLAERWSVLSWLRAYLLQVRWAVALLVILLAYVFISFFTSSYFLTALGSLGMTALLQVVTPVFGGLFWARGNTRGAIWGMSVGLLVWFYTLLLPILLREYAWLPGLLEFGPGNLSWLRPEGLFGVDTLDKTAHGMFFSMGLNTLIYILISVLFTPHKQERNLTSDFMQLFNPHDTERQVRPTGLDDYISFDEKYKEALQLLSHYLRNDKALLLLQQIVEDLHITTKKQINIIELVEFHRMVENELSGSIGTSSSHQAMQHYVQYSARESNELKAIYHHIATEIKETDTPGAAEQHRGDTVDALQHQIAELKVEIGEKEQLIESMRTKLDRHYEEIHRLRMDAQKYQTFLELQARMDQSQSEHELKLEDAQLKQLLAEFIVLTQQLKKQLEKKPSDDA